MEHPDDFAALTAVSARLGRRLHHMHTHVGLVHLSDPVLHSDYAALRETLARLGVEIPDLTPHRPVGSLGTLDPLVRSNRI